MPVIGDQVATLEHDHIEALAKIDALTASLAAVTSANAALTAENAALNKYADEIKAMVESVASGALKMLQAARAPIVAAKVVAEVKPLVLDVAGFLGDTPIASELLPAEIPPATPEELDEQDAGNANALASDSDDEQPVLTVLQAAPMWINRVAPTDAETVETKIADLSLPDAVDANALASDSGDEHRPALRANDLTDEQLGAHIADVAIRQGALLSPDEKTEVLAAIRQINPRVSDAILPIQRLAQDTPDAVERMLHHSSASSAPPVTSIRMPVDMTMIVEHDVGGLPLFLRRGTTFDALARARHAT